MCVYEQIVALCCFEEVPCVRCAALHCTARTIARVCGDSMRRAALPPKRVNREERRREERRREEGSEGNAQVMRCGAMLTIRICHNK